MVSVKQIWLHLKARLHGASYWLASLTVAGFPTGRQLLDRQLDWPLLFTRCQLLASQFDSSWIPNWPTATG
jgi:hypothetical protein